MKILSNPFMNRTIQVLNFRNNRLFQRFRAIQIMVQKRSYEHGYSEKYDTHLLQCFSGIPVAFLSRTQSLFI